jgi:hypothetical protein
LDKGSVQEMRKEDTSHFLYYVSFCLPYIKFWGVTKGNLTVKTGLSVEIAGLQGPLGVYPLPKAIYNVVKLFKKLRMMFAGYTGYKGWGIEVQYSTLRGKR